MQTHRAHHRIAASPGVPVPLRPNSSQAPCVHRLLVAPMTHPAPRHEIVLDTVKSDVALAMSGPATRIKLMGLSLYNSIDYRAASGPQSVMIVVCSRMKSIIVITLCIISENTIERYSLTHTPIPYSTLIPPPENHRQVTPFRILHSGLTNDAPTQG